MYELVTDLARHRRDVSAEPRDWHGRWTKAGGTLGLISGRHEQGVPRIGRRGGGSHLLLPGGEADRWSPEGKTPEEIAKHIDDAVSRARDLDPGTTAYEHAWSEIAAHTEALARHAKEEGEKAMRGKRKGDEVKGVKAAKDVGKVYRERGTETFSVAALANLGTHIAAGAGGLISAEQANHYGEQFHMIAESTGGEITLAVVVTFLISALAALLKRAVEKHREKRITKARGHDPEYTMLPLDKPASPRNTFPQRVSPSANPLRLA